MSQIAHDILEISFNVLLSYDLTRHNMGILKMSLWRHLYVYIKISLRCPFQLFFRFYSNKYEVNIFFNANLKVFQRFLNVLVRYQRDVLNMSSFVTRYFFWSLVRHLKDTKCYLGYYLFKLYVREPIFLPLILLL